MASVPVNKIEKLVAFDLEQLGRVAQPYEIGDVLASFAIVKPGFCTLTNELNSLDLYNYFPCRRPTVHFHLGY